MLCLRRGCTLSPHASLSAPVTATACNHTSVGTRACSLALREHAFSVSVQGYGALLVGGLCVAALIASNTSRMIQRLAWRPSAAHACFLCCPAPHGCTVCGPLLRRATACPEGANGAWGALGPFVASRRGHSCILARRFSHLLDQSGGRKWQLPCSPLRAARTPAVIQVAQQRRCTASTATRLSSALLQPCLRPSRQRGRDGAGKTGSWLSMRRRARGGRDVASTRRTDA